MSENRDPLALAQAVKERDGKVNADPETMQALQRAEWEDRERFMLFVVNMCQRHLSFKASTMYHTSLSTLM